MQKLRIKAFVHQIWGCQISPNQTFFQSSSLSSDKIRLIITWREEAPDSLSRTQFKSAASSQLGI